MFGADGRQGWLALSLHPGRVDVAHVRRSGGRPRIAALDSYRREGADAVVLERLRKGLKLGQHRCLTLLRPGEYQMVQTEAPNVPDAELREAVRWRIKDMLDYPVQAATLDVVQIPLDTVAPGRPRSLFAVAANNNVIAGRMAAFEEAGIPLEVIDIPEMAQRNVAALFEEENRGLALLSFDEAGGLLTFTRGGELYASRRIEISSEQLAEGDAEGRARQIERAALEVQRSLDHFDRQFGSIPLSSLLVAAVRGLPDLARQFAGNVYLPVEDLDLGRVVDFPDVPELRNTARQAECLHVIGAALRNGGRVA